MDERKECFKRKNKVKKRCHVYSTQPSWWSFMTSEPYFYDSTELNVYRSISNNMAERKDWYNALDYGYRPRPNRSPAMLPTSWDDKGCAMWFYRKSWKHNSKRRKQWKYE